MGTFLHVKHAACMCKTCDADNVLMSTSRYTPILFMIRLFGAMEKHSHEHESTPRNKSQCRRAGEPVPMGGTSHLASLDDFSPSVFMSPWIDPSVYQVPASKKNDDSCHTRLGSS